MNEETKKHIDTMLENIFGRFGPQISLCMGILLVVAGIIIFVTKKPKGKSRIALGVLIGVGCIGILSGIVQMTVR